MNMSKTMTSVTRWKAVAVGLTFLIAGLVIWDGADRRAADSTQPLIRNATSKGLNPTPRKLKLGSFNIHGGKGTDGIRNLSRTFDLLKDVDFVGLYEVRALTELERPNQAAALGRLCDCESVFAPTERQWWSDHFGNGLLFRIPVSSIVRIPLVNTRGKAFRNAILSTVPLEKDDVRILSVHIDRESDRRTQLQTVIDLFLNLKVPCVLMGDLNTTATDPLLISLREQPGVRSPFHELHETLNEPPPNQMIDWIFTRGLNTELVTATQNSASDHPVLKAVIEPIDN